MVGRRDLIENASAPESLISVEPSCSVRRIAISSADPHNAEACTHISDAQHAKHPLNSVSMGFKTPSVPAQGGEVIAAVRVGFTLTRQRRVC